jgi:hypothetical protein
MCGFEVNTTKYIITVSTNALDDNALLTSVLYTINETGSTGTISGFEVGTTLRTVFEGVTAPETASLFTVYNADGSYASFKQINFDTVYVDVIASDRVFFEVTAQDGVTKMTYQLQPNSESTDAYVLSNVYDIDQSIALIKLVPDGINVSSFFNSLLPAPGSTLELQNNMGQIREMGSIYKDDKLIVTAQDGVTKKVYSLKMLSETALERMAFIYSDVYVVNLSAKNVKLPFGTEVDVADFASNIIVSTGATYVIQNADATAKTSGIMVAGDMIVVTSADGSVVNTYTVGFMVSSPIFKQGIIKMYPNPTTGDVKIYGVQPGNNIAIYNTDGRKVTSFRASSILESTSLHQHPNGMYFMVVDNGSQVVGRFKLVKK